MTQEVSVIEEQETPISRNEQMLFDYVFRGKKQVDIAKEYGLERSSVSRAIATVINDKEIQARLHKQWEKRYLTVAKSKALQLVEAVDPQDHPATKRVVDSATLVDKTRLLEDKSTENISNLNISLNLSSKAKNVSQVSDSDSE